MIKKSVRHFYQQHKKLLYRHSCWPYGVSDVREQESTLSLNMNLFLNVPGFRFTTFQIPCHTQPNTQAARNDDQKKEERKKYLINKPSRHSGRGMCVGCGESRDLPARLSC